MFKQYLLFSVFIFLNWNLTAQCPSGNVILTSQAEVDAFLVDYPNCTQINGNLTIGDSFLATDITDLSPLSNLTLVGGPLKISANGSLASLEGLNGLSSVGGYLSINNNHMITSLEGLTGLTSVGGYFNVYNNGSLINFSGLTALASVGDYFYVGSNNSLTSFSGLTELTSVGDYFYVEFNDVLINFSGLTGLTSVGGYFRVGSNSSLTSFSGLTGLTSVDGYLGLGSNASLTSLEGLENIDPVGITILTISNNGQLSNCAVESICVYLGIEMSAATISGNATGCNSRIEVEMACDSRGDLCDNAFDIDNLLGQGIDLPQTSDLYDNTNNTATDTPTNGFECHEGEDAISHSLWVSFTGDGNTYSMTAIQCAATEENYLDNTQMALYSGECTNLMPVDCNEDEDTDQNLFNAELIFETEVGVNYFLLLDGYDVDAGEFCLEVTQIMPVAVEDIARTNIKVFPNPTKGLVQFHNLVVESVIIFNPQGQRVAQYDSPTTEVDMSTLPAGVYYLSLRTGSDRYSARVVKVD